MTLTVSSGDFLRAYGRISEAALKEPVSITSHGRKRLVLLSADEYHRLRRHDRAALYPWELSETDLAALETSEPPAVASHYDHEVSDRT